MLRLLQIFVVPPHIKMVTVVRSERRWHRRSLALRHRSAAIFFRPFSSDWGLRVDSPFSDLGELRCVAGHKTEPHRRWLRLFAPLLRHTGAFAGWTGLFYYSQRVGIRCAKGHGGWCAREVDVVISRNLFACSRIVLLQIWSFHLLVVYLLGACTLS